MEERLAKLEAMLKSLKQVHEHYFETLSLGTIIRSIESKINYYKKLRK